MEFLLDEHFYRKKEKSMKKIHKMKQNFYEYNNKDIWFMNLVFMIMVWCFDAEKTCSNRMRSCDGDSKIFFCRYPFFFYKVCLFE